MVRIAGILLFAVIAMAAILPVCAEEGGEQDKGLFTDGSFLSEAISSAASKIGKVTSGDERLLDKDAKGIDQDTLEYDGDPLGRSRAISRQDARITKESKGGHYEE
ncbi:MAG: hypothetical protein WC522_07160 [Candidatus Omnitrophota bacterium]